VSEIELEQELRLLGEAFRGIREQHGLSAGELVGATGVEETRIAELFEHSLTRRAELKGDGVAAIPSEASCPPQP